MSSKKNKGYSRRIRRKRRMATKICRNKKKHWLNNRIKEIEEAQKKKRNKKILQRHQDVQKERTGRDIITMQRR